MNILGIVSTLSMNIKPFVTGIKSATKEASNFSKKLQSEMSKSTSGTESVTKGAKNMASGFKDVSRIVQGIAVSKTIYGILGAITDASKAVWDFSESLEYADMVYTNLFGDTELADTFIATLKELAAVSPFEFTGIEKATKRLKAYGIETENLLYVTQGILAASTAQGNPEVIESISRAIGQIYTKGVLKAEEARQLAEAGIPVYKILAEKLNLTQEQLGNLADQGISASTAINALVDGMNEKFGSLLESSAKSMQGIMSNIHDNLLMMSSDAIEPFYNKVKTVLSGIGDRLQKLRKITAKGGLGALFENVIPKNLQSGLREFIANIIVLASGIKQIILGIAQTFMGVAPTLLGILNTFLSVIANVAYFLGAVYKRIRENEAAMKFLIVALSAGAIAWAIWKAQAMAAAAVTGLVKVFNGITSAVRTLAAALTILVKHPVWIFLIVVGGLALGLAAKFGVLNNIILKVKNALSSLSGIKPSGILNPSTTNGATSSIEDFNKKLSDTGDGLSGITDDANKAAKAAKGLLAFDEVFKLNESSGSDSGSQLDDLANGLEDLDALDLSGLGDGLDWDNILPSVDGIKDWGKGIIDSLLDALNPEIIGGLIGAALGAALGWLVGGPLGALIGAGLGAVAGVLWTKLADMLGLTDAETLGIPIGAAIGAAVGWVMGGPAGAAIGAAIGALVGWLAALFYDGFVNGNWQEQKLATLMGTAVGAAIGFMVGGPSGALIGAAIGTLVGYIGGLLYDGFANGDWHVTQLSTSMGLAIGAAIGFVIGGPAGAAIGAAIGALVGGIAGLLYDGFANGNWNTQALSVTIGTALGAVIGMVLGGPAGAAIGAAVGALVGDLIGIIIEKFQIGEWKMGTEAISVTIGTALGAAIGLVFGGPAGAAIGAAAGALVGDIVGVITEKFQTGKWKIGPLPDFGTPIVEGITKAKDKVVAAFKTFVQGFDDTNAKIAATFDSIVAAVNTKMLELVAPVVNLGIDFVQAFQDINTRVGEIFATIVETISTKAAEILAPIKTLGTDIWSALTTLFRDIVGAVKIVIKDVVGAVTIVGTELAQIFTDILDLLRLMVIWAFDKIQKAVEVPMQYIKDFINTILTEITEIFTIVWTAVSEFVTTILTTISDTFTMIWTSIKDTLTVILTNISTTFTFVWTTIKAYILLVLTEIKDIFTLVWTAIKDFFTLILDTIFTIIKTIFTNVTTTIKTLVDKMKEIIVLVWTAIKDFFAEKLDAILTAISDAFSEYYDIVKEKIGNMYDTAKDGIANIYKVFTDWISDMWTNVFKKLFDWIDEGITKLKDFFRLKAEAESSSIPTYTKSSSKGHATGGVFNREHYAKFAEGNKAEAIIPLENNSAMQPFVDAVANGLTSSLAPIVASLSNNVGGGYSEGQLRPLYVGTLIADEQGIKELNKQMQIIEIQEQQRRGL